MKIAYISPIFYSDVDLSYLNELRKLAEVYYFIPIGPLKKAAAVDIEQIYPEAGIFPASVYPELNKFGKLIDLEKTFIINRTAPHVSYPQNIKVYWELYKFINKLDVDIVQITSSLLYTQFPLYLFHKKMVLSVHDPLPHANVKSWRSDMQLKIAYKLIDHLVIFNSAQKEEFIKKYHLYSKSIYLSQLSAYTYLTAYDTKDAIVKGEYILFFGWIREGKGVENLLPAMKKVHDIIPNLKLVVAGKGKYYFDKSEYESLEYITFINRFVPDYELANLIANSKFVVVPYTEATQSGVIMSAFAFSKPVLATNVGGLPEMVGDDDFGKVVEAGSTAALEEGIIEMVNDESIIIRNRTNIKKEYHIGEKSWATIAKSVYEKVYQTIIMR
jgi:glycosyltransferase involved in cell wall biosynthesis